MIEATIGDITKIRVDAIVNAANGVGIMGAGVAGAISRAGGDIVSREAKAACRELSPCEGDVYSTSAGKLKHLGVKKVYHAVTMKFPGGSTSYFHVENAFKKVLAIAKKDGMKSLATCALGTGIGGLDKTAVADIMFKLASKEEDIKIIFIDRNEEFIEAIKSKLFERELE